ncbi:ATP-binding protein [Streptomyces termitum]|uniref:ATP-binding protein n=1 Tax=Streptomyces termitum TaxID=67368 RepID=UPI0033BBDBAB
MSETQAVPHGSRVVVLRWPQAARSVPLARHELRLALERWGWGAMEDVAALVLSELLANAVRHARVPGREIETRFTRRERSLRIEVHDASGKRPSMTVPFEGAAGGRGLLLVDALATTWGVDGRHGPGKQVWAELAVDAGAEEGAHRP